VSGLVPCLVTLRGEFDRIAPGRDKGADGWVGDAAHQETSSDHNWDETGQVPIRDPDTINEVHAIDVDASGPWPAGLSMERLVQHVVARRDPRLRYVIYNRRIWRADQGWRESAYTLPNGHVAHAHFSASYDTAREADTRPWGLTDLVEDAVTPEEWKKLINTDNVLETREWMEDHGKNPGTATATLWYRTGDEAAAAHAAAKEALDGVAALAAAVEQVSAKLDTLSTGGVDVDAVAARLADLVAPAVRQALESVEYGPRSNTP